MIVDARPKVGVILANLGTPDAPTPSAVRRYLKEFLSDPRVIEVPRLIWFFVLNLLILPLRPKRVAKAYAAIWQSDSPMRIILLEQVSAMQSRLSAAFPALDIRVRPAMSYGNPRFAQALADLRQEGVEHLILLPLFPQFSATSTGPLYDQLAKWTLTQRNLPSVQIIRDYHLHPLYIAALADSIQRHWQHAGRADKLLFSFHGIPQPYADQGDPYANQCRATARAVADYMGLQDGEWAQSFQSLFGLQEWVKPYTSQVLDEWAHDGVKSVQVLCPAFSADCLETIEEVDQEYRAEFLQAGGERYEYIPALNTDPMHLALFDALLAPQIVAAVSGHPVVAVQG